MGCSEVGVAPEITKRVFDRLVEKKYVDDKKFAYFWVENRFINKGISRRKLVSELKLKGVDNSIINQILDDSERSDSDEIIKIITKKMSQYTDEKKLIAYLARQGFGYEEIKQALSNYRQT